MKKVFLSSLSAIFLFAFSVKAQVADQFVIGGLSATYAPAINQKWTSVSFSIRNSLTTPLVVPGNGFVSVDFYVAPSNSPNQNLSNFVKVGDMPAKVGTVAPGANLNFTVAGIDVSNIAREWSANAARVGDGFYFLYAQVRQSQSNSLIAASKGAFAPVGFVVGNAGVSVLKVEGLTAVRAAATNQAFAPVSFSIKNLSASNYATPAPGFVSIDFYATPSNATNQPITNFVKIGDMPGRLPSLNANASQNFTVAGQDVFNIAREWLANPSRLKDGSYFVYVQIRPSNGQIVPTSGAFSSAAFTVGVAAAEVPLIGSKWYLVETKMNAILMTLTFEAGGKASYKQTNGTNTGVFTWSGTSNNLTIEGPFGSGTTIKMAGSIATGKLSYTAGAQTGEYGISKKTNCKACNTNYASKPLEQWTAADKDTAIWLLNALTGAEVRSLQNQNFEQIKALIDQLCL
jgi:hypothetical protein